MAIENGGVPKDWRMIRRRNRLPMMWWEDGCLNFSWTGRRVRVESECQLRNELSLLRIDIETIEDLVNTFFGEWSV